MLKIKMINKLVIFIYATFLFADIGDVIHSIPAPGYYSNGLGWDGESLWVANIADANHPEDYWYRMFKISPENGDIISSFSTNPYFYHGLTYDGENLWGEHNYTTIAKLNHLGQILQDFSAIPLAVGLAIDPDNNILYQSTTQPGAIYKIDLNTEEIIGELHPNEPYENGWGDLAFDGNFLWHTNIAADTIYKIHPDTGEILDEFPAPSGQCEGLTFDGNYLWTSDTNLDILYQIDIEFEFLEGDTNNDGVIDILDIIVVVNLILTGQFSETADLNGDDIINVLDILLIINLILE